MTALCKCWSCLDAPALPNNLSGMAPFHRQPPQPETAHSGKNSQIIPPPRRKNFGWKTRGGTEASLTPDHSTSHPVNHKPHHDESPAKRRKLSPGTSVCIKQEDVSRLGEPSRKLITSGAKLYAPLPPQCQKSNRDFRAQREAWARKERLLLNEHGLNIVKVFVREDGMVIDWTSEVPVWSDTLLPNRLENTDDIMETTEADSPTVNPTLATSISGSNLAGSHPARSPPSAGPPSNPAANIVSPAAECTCHETQTMENSALDFLTHYIQALDSDIQTLHDLYASDALFSYRVQGPVVRRGDASGPTSIVQALRTLGEYQPHASLQYDIVYLHDTHQVLLVAYSPDMSVGTIRYQHNFVLRRHSASSPSGKAKWPLVAVCHQMNIRGMDNVG